MKYKEIISLITEADRLFASGHPAEAVNPSGEGLAMCDSIWTRELRCGRVPEPELTVMLARCGISHCRALSGAGMCSLAFSTSTMILFQISAAGCYGVLPLSLRMELIFLAYTGVIRLVQDGNTGEDEFVREHVGHIICYLYSMLYATYREAEFTRVPEGLLKAVYLTLKEGKEEIPCMWPTATVNGESADYSDPRPILADLLGRARAVGFLKGE